MFLTNAYINRRVYIYISISTFRCFDFLLDISGLLMMPVSESLKAEAVWLQAQVYFHTREYRV